MSRAYAHLLANTHHRSIFVVAIQRHSNNGCGSHLRWAAQKRPCFLTLFFWFLLHCSENQREQKWLKKHLMEFDCTGKISNFQTIWYRNFLCADVIATSMYCSIGAPLPLFINWSSKFRLNYVQHIHTDGISRRFKFFTWPLIILKIFFFGHYWNCGCQHFCATWYGIG